MEMNIQQVFLGDLTLIVRIDPGEGRRWESDRLIQTVSVPYTTLLLGGEAKLTTPTGRKNPSFNRC